MAKIRIGKSIAIISILICLCLMVHIDLCFGAETKTTIKKPVITDLEYIDDKYIQIKWSKVFNADGYQIYRSLSKNGTYKRIATTKSNKRTYKDLKVKDNKKYYYKVRAYTKSDGQFKYGKFSKKKSETTIVSDTERLYSFLSISDSHVRNVKGDDGSLDLSRAIDFSNNADEIMFICHCGDAVDGGTDLNLLKYKEIIGNSTKSVYTISGNHEAITSNGNIELKYNSLTEYFGYPLYYLFEFENDVFIMLGESGYTNGNFFADGELQFMYDTLEANRNKRVFIYQHVFNWDEGDSGNPNNLYENDLFNVGPNAAYRQKEKKCFIDMLKHYKNTIWIHGHSHALLELQDLESWANYSEQLGYRSLHNPSIARPKNENGEYMMNASQGYIIDAYKNHIVVKGRDFVRGQYLPITYKISTKLVKIKEKTFVDKTGIINTQ